MQKLITSFLIAITITFLLGEVVKKKFEEKWYLTLTYEHIARQLNLNYMLLNPGIANRTEKNFELLVSKLKRDIIITRNSKNACTTIRGLEANPNILLKFVELNLEMTMTSKDKKLLEKCEKFLDDQIEEYNLINQEIMNRIIKERDNPIIFEDSNEMNKVLKNLVKQFETDVLEGFLENQTTTEAKLRFATLMMNLMSSINVYDVDISLDEISKLDFVKKTFSNYQKKDENVLLMYFGLFIIIQSILLILFFSNKKTISYFKRKAKNFNF